MTRYLLPALLTVLLAPASTPAVAQTLTTTDVFVPWMSTAPVDAGQVVALHVRRKSAPNPRDVVLFVHGATGPSVPDFDLEFKDYNWMATLARAGFDTWAMDLSGYGSSPRPMLDDPCNADPRQQEALLLGRPLKAVCPPSYPRQITTSQHEWQEIDAVVDYIRRVTGKERLNMIGWSLGGARVGGYASMHPEKIARLMLYAPSPPNAGLQLSDQPGDGPPLVLQTRSVLLDDRWGANVKCAGQVEPGAREAVWNTTMEWDRIGRSWGGGDGVMRSPLLTGFGWRPEMAARITAPTLVIAGDLDIPDQRKQTYDLLGSSDKVWIRVACASHFMLWEKQHAVLHRVSLEWLSTGRIAGVSRGSFTADVEGELTRVR